MSAPSPTECLPPDPSVSGLWWVRQADGSCPESVRWRAWLWTPGLRVWGVGTAVLTPGAAYVLGWCCVGPAVPPGVQRDHSALLDDLRRELRHPVMAHTGLGEVDASLLRKCLAALEWLSAVPPEVTP